MKKVLIAAAVILGLAACNSGTETASKDDHSGHDHEMASKATTATDAKGPLDPVCNMVKGDNWTEFSVTGSDTTWFCSPHCKETFDADPAKYAKKG